MTKTLDPFRFLLFAIAGWMNQRQQHAIEYLREENRVWLSEISYAAGCRGGGEPIVPSGSCEVADGGGWIRRSPLSSVDGVRRLRKCHRDPEVSK